LLKEQSGVGAALPGAGVNAQQQVAVHVGQPIGAPFPTTIRRLFALSNAELSTLAILFNDDFGITADDNLSQRKARFQQFIGGL
jgi:hypothetical protein